MVCMGEAFKAVLSECLIFNVLGFVLASNIYGFEFILHSVQ